MRSILVIIALHCIYQAHGQDYFSIVLPSPDTARVGRGVEFLEEDILIRVGTRCEPDARSCGHLLRLSPDGTIISRTIIDDFIWGNNNTMLVNDDKVYITGYNTYATDTSSFGRVVLDKDLNRLNTSYTTLEQASIAINYGSLILKNHNIVQYGALQYEDGYRSYLFVYSDSLGNHIKTDEYSMGFAAHNIWDVHELSDGSLIYLTEINEETGVTPIPRYNSIEILDSNGDISTLYKTEYTPTGILFPFRMIRAGEQFVFSTYEDIATTGFQSINIDGSENWFINIEYEFWPHNHNFNELAPCSNGDFIILGTYLDKLPSGLEIEQSGMISRLDSDGKVLWHRLYRQTDPITGDYRMSTIADIEEDENGDLVATGVVRNIYNGVTVSDTWIMKLDENGCLGDSAECGGLLITDVEEIAAPQSEIRVYPNPVSRENSITISGLDSQSQPYRILDMYGRQVAVGVIDGNNPTISPRIAPGVYFISIPSKDSITKIIVL